MKCPLCNSVILKIFMSYSNIRDKHFTCSNYKLNHKYDIYFKNDAEYQRLEYSKTVLESFNNQTSFSKRISPKYIKEEITKEQYFAKIKLWQLLS